MKYEVIDPATEPGLRIEPIKVVATQLENDRRQQQEKFRKDFYRYSRLAAQAKKQLMRLTQEQINLKIWGPRNELQKVENVGCEIVGSGTEQCGERGIEEDSEKGKKGCL